MYTPLMAKRVKDFWDNWGIELLVTVSCGMHMALTLFGSSRRRMIAGQGLVRFVIWSAYLLLTYVVTVIVGKLTLIPVNDSTKENTDSELKGFLAPLLLVQLGSRDAITAYSIEDDRLGLRQFPNLLAQFSSVLWILFRTWNNTLVSYLYFPLLLAGFIKSGENAWALYASLTSDKYFKPDAISKVFEKMPTNIPNLEMILKAYYRFLCLKPHIENWAYRPLYKSLPYLSIDNFDSPHDIFKITDIELGFMYDVLYTKAPIVYTWTGFVLRLITSLSLVSCSIAFAFWFKDAFVYYINAGFTFVVLGVIITLEAYQIYMLFFSDWAIVKMFDHRNNQTVRRLMSFLAPQSSKWKRWSNTLGQFNIISYCLDYDHLYFSRILKFQGLDVEIRKYFCTTSVGIPNELRVMLINEIVGPEEQIGSKPISKRVELALARHGVTDGSDLFKYSVESTEFDKSIIVWHLATEICYHLDTEKEDPDKKREMGRTLSNYMMYLLAVRSQMLSITTSEIVFESARNQIMAFLKRCRIHSSVTDVQNACTQILKEPKESNFRGPKELKAENETMLTTDWYLLRDAKQVSENLLTKDNRWEVICSVWVEMLCFAATNCRAEYHSEQLRRGGEIVTHVWLMLLHKTEDHLSRNVAKDKENNLEEQVVEIEG